MARLDHDELANKMVKASADALRSQLLLRNSVEQLAVIVLTTALPMLADDMKQDEDAACDYGDMKLPHIIAELEP